MQELSKHVPNTNLLRRHVVRSSDVCTCEQRIASEHTSQTKIAELNIVIGVKENVGRFQVAVKHGAFLARVAIMERERCLQEYFPDHRFVDPSLLAATLFDVSGKITSWAIFHDDVDLGLLLLDDAVIVPHNVWMPELPQDVDLCHQQVLLLLTHLTIIQHLPHEDATVALAADLRHRKQAVSVHTIRLLYRWSHWLTLWTVPNEPLPTISRGS